MSVKRDNFPFALAPETSRPETSILWVRESSGPGDGPSAAHRWRQGVLELCLKQQDKKRYDTLKTTCLYTMIPENANTTWMTFNNDVNGTFHKHVHGISLAGS